MRAGEPVAIYIVTEDPNGRPVELYWPAAEIEEVIVGPWFGRIKQFTVQPLDEGFITPIPHSPKHRKGLHVKENNA